MTRLLNRLKCWLGYHNWNRFVFEFRPGEILLESHDLRPGNVACKRCETIKRYPFDFI